MDGWVPAQTVMDHLGVGEARLVALRAKRRGLPVREIGGRLHIRAADVGGLANYAVLPDTEVYARDVEREAGLTHGVLSKRATYRGTAYRKQGVHVVFSRADVPALLARHHGGGTQHAKPSPPDGAADRIIAAVSAHTGVTVEMIYSYARTANTIAARHLTVGALHEAGYAPAAIGRTMQRDHATIINSLMRVAEDPTQAETARRIATEAVTSPTIGKSIAVALRAYPAQRPDVVAYIYGCLLGRRGYSPCDMLAGLRALAAHSGIRQAVYATLTDMEMAGHCGRIRCHMDQAGYRVAS